jgi:phage gp36-like protein
MPAYCEPSEIGRYGVNAEAIGELNDELITPVIVAVSDEIDTYLRQQYVLPLTRWGSDITKAAAVMAAWEIISVRGFKPGENIEDSPLRLRYEDVKAWLKMVAAGTVAPDVDDSDTSTPAAGAQSGSARVTSNSQRGYFSEDASRVGPFQGGRR